MIKSIIFFILLTGSMSFAQSHLVSGNITPVKEDGLYRIRIPQNIRSYATKDLRDFRVWDTKGQQVPYFIQPTSDYKKTKVSDFEAFPIISNTRIADSNATYIFKNSYKTLDKAVLLIANYQGNKTYRLEGSNDQEHWFGLVNSGQLNQLSHAIETRVYKTIHFPVCSYPYLKIVFDDRHSLPINLLEIGIANTETLDIVPVTMENVPVESITFLEKDKKTQIHARFERPEGIDQIQMVITAPDLYSRNAELYTLKEEEVKRRLETYREYIATFTIRSDKALVFDLPTTIEQDIYLEIDNKDNPKLHISDIHFMQAPVYLVASLKQGEPYKVTAGNDNLNFPDYDIFDATNTTKNELPIAEINTVAYQQPVTKAKDAIPFWQQSWFMWCCIGLAAIMISYFAFSLLKDLSKNKH
ncbi:DUF3999 family protein [Mariniflexile ostreae]|uniref:DUF3999 family protein n=1 Tax=Mariniflexile ostreae TaxID=1520892 RepID=A0ABV5FFD6_9FLAO